MSKYRAIVSLTFDDEDLETLAENIGTDVESVKDSLSETVEGCLDNVGLGTGWVEQIFKDTRPLIRRLSGGLTVEINEHD